MSGLRKDVTYTFEIEWEDGRSATALARTVDQAERIANRKRFGKRPPRARVVRCHATNDDRPKARTR
jgi:hypothetical protein